MVLPAPVGLPRPRIMSAPLALLSAANFCALTSFYLLLTVVPMYAERSGGGGVGAGLTTGALMLTTVLAELVSPWLVRRFGYRTVLVTGLVLLGAPALALAGGGGMALILTVCLVRGFGFAVVMVAESALAATMIPAERRGEALGLLGVFNGLPGVLALPAGVWLANRYGFPPVFAAAAALCLAAAAIMPLVRIAGPGRTRAAAGHAAAGGTGGAGGAGRATGGDTGHAATSGASGAGVTAGHGADRAELGVLAGLRMGALVRPSIMFFATAMAAGIVMTFLPSALGPDGTDLATTALLANTLIGMPLRWWAGRYADRHGASRLLVPGVLLAAAGMALLVPGGPVAVAGALVLGAGFAITQNASMTLMLEVGGPSGHGAAIAIWSVAYDGGLGAGAAGFGVLAAHTGFPGAFAIGAALIPLAALAARRRTQR